MTSQGNLRTVKPLLPTTDILVVNAPVLAAIAAVDPITLDPKEIAMSVLSPEARSGIVVVTLGAKGQLPGLPSKLSQRAHTTLSS